MNTRDLIQQYLSDIENGIIKTRAGQAMKPATTRTYKHAINLYKDFGVFEITKFLPNLPLAKRNAIADDFKKHMDKFTESLYVSVNSKAIILNIVSMALNHIANNLGIAIPKTNKPKPIEQPITTLDAEFVKKFLTDEEKYNSFSDRNKAMWEVCAIMLITSLRIKDAVALTEMDFDESANGLFMLKQNEKTGTVTTTPLTSFLSKVISNNINKHHKVYTPSHIKLCPGGVRRDIPEFFKLYEATHIDVIVRKYDRDRNIKSTIHKLYNVIHPHMLRKTAITLMLANGVSPEHVKFSSGHSANSRSFDRYIGFSDQRFQSQIKNFYDKIL